MCVIIQFTFILSIITILLIVLRLYPYVKFLKKLKKKTLPNLITTSNLS